MAVATDASGKKYESVNGVLTVPKGIYSVEWALDDTPITVYVDEANGSDSNKGLTATTAFKTINAAIDAIQNSDSAKGTIVVVGTLTFDNKVQKLALSDHTKMITITGQNSSSSLALSNTVSLTFTNASKVWEAGEKSFIEFTYYASICKFAFIVEGIS